MSAQSNLTGFHGLQIRWSYRSPTCSRATILLKSADKTTQAHCLHTTHPHTTLIICLAMEEDHDAPHPPHGFNYRRTRRRTNYHHRASSSITTSESRIAKELLHTATVCHAASYDVYAYGLCHGLRRRCTWKVLPALYERPLLSFYGW